MATICCWPPESDWTGVGPLLPQHREEIEDPLERPAAGARRRRMVDRDAEIVFDGHAGEQAPPFGDDRHALRNHAVRLRPADRAALEAHHVGGNAQQAHDRFQQGRLAGAVGADQGDDLAGADLEVYAVERLEVAVAGDQPVGRQQRRAHASMPM